MKLLNSLLLLIAICFVSSCTQASPEEKLLSDAFRAMKSHDWDAFKKLMITTSDYDMKANGISTFKERLSYSNIHRDEEWAAQKAVFEKALKRGSGYVDFEGSEFAGVGRKIAAGKRETLTGGSINVETYALKIKNKRSGAQQENLFPYFVLSKWNEKPKILSIVLPPEEESEGIYDE